MQRNEPHWLLNDQDAKAYGQALQNAIRHLPVSRAQKAVDFTMFAIAAFNFEVPRVYMSAQLARQRRAQPPGPARGPAQIFKFNPPPPSGPHSPVAPQTPSQQSATRPSGGNPFPQAGMGTPASPAAASGNPFPQAGMGTHTSPATVPAGPKPGDTAIAGFPAPLPIEIDGLPPFGPEAS